MNYKEFQEYKKQSWHDVAWVDGKVYIKYRDELILVDFGILEPGADFSIYDDLVDTFIKDIESEEA